jgi:hypothetical protein
MLEFNAAKFLKIMHTLDNTESQFRQFDGPIDSNLADLCNKSAKVMDDLCNEIGLPTSGLLTNYIVSAKNGSDLAEALRLVKKSIHAELQNRLFFEPNARLKPLFQNPCLFGVGVFDAFPSANEDISEAGTCLALERPTACVMHLNRANEVGLKALAKSVGVSSQKDWGSYIREITKELDSRAKTSGSRSGDEQFYAEAAIIFDHMKRAWRNPTMHVEKTYSVERAEEILVAVKSFMRHLSARLSE